MFCGGDRRGRKGRIDRRGATTPGARRPYRHGLPPPIHLSTVSIFRGLVLDFCGSRGCDGQAAPLTCVPVSFLNVEMLGSTAKSSLPPRLRLVGNGCGAEASIAAAPVR